MLSADRGRPPLAVAVGGGGRGGGGAGGGGGEGGGLGTGELEDARGRAPPKQLRKKSVSFTGDETYQVGARCCRLLVPLLCFVGLCWGSRRRGSLLDVGKHPTRAS